MWKWENFEYKNEKPKIDICTWTSFLHNLSGQSTGAGSSGIKTKSASDVRAATNAK